MAACLLRLEVSPGAHDIARQVAAFRKRIPPRADRCRCRRRRPPRPRPPRGRSAAVSAGTSSGARRPRLPAKRASKAGKNEGAAHLRIFGSHAMARSRFCELAGPAAEGVRFPLLFVPTRLMPTPGASWSRFAAERHRVPDYTAALTYDATRLLIEAIRRPGRTGPAFARSCSAFRPGRASPGRSILMAPARTPAPISAWPPSVMGPLSQCNGSQCRT